MDLPRPLLLERDVSGLFRVLVPPRLQQLSSSHQHQHLSTQENKLGVEGASS